MSKYEICVIGGLGRIGFPLALMFADSGFSVSIYDVDKDRAMEFYHGTIDVREKDLQEIYERVSVGVYTEEIPLSRIYMLCIGTELDKFSVPRTSLIDFVKENKNTLSEGLVVIRSTLYPGATKVISDILGTDVAYCPERVAEGKSFQEIPGLPQIVGVYSHNVCQRLKTVFGSICEEVVCSSPEEAEFAKLFCNAYRYIHFSIANEFYQICEDANVNFAIVRSLMRNNYPRAETFPDAGFVGGYCLRKDTLQLTSSSLGGVAAKVNEGLADFLVNSLGELSGVKVGLLGMAFKPNSSDTRDSLSFRVKKLCELRGAIVSCYDPIVGDPRYLDKQGVFESDIVIVCTMHHSFGEDILRLRNKGKKVVIAGARTK